MTVPVCEEPLIPQPSPTVPALRKAIMQIDPGALPEFTRHLSNVVEEAEQKGSFNPFRTFCLFWGIHVYIHRQPRLARRFRELETVPTRDGHTLDEFLAAGAELGRILDEAQTAVLEDMRS